MRRHLAFTLLILLTLVALPTGQRRGQPRRG